MNVGESFTPLKIPTQAKTGLNGATDATTAAGDGTKDVIGRRGNVDFRT
jgi:hypothetical protein